MTKEDEIQIFQRFIDSLEPYNNWKFESRDKPDIKLIKSKKLIGVEITEIQDQKRRARQMLIKNIGESVVDKLDNYYDKSFHLGLTFQPSLKIKKSEINEYSKLIAKQIQELIGSKPTEAHYHYNLDTVSTNGLTGFTIMFADVLIKSYLGESAVGFLPDFTDDNFFKILSKKEMALNTYGQFDEQWLLIIEGNFLAGSIDKIKIDTGKIQSNFDRIFIFRQQTNEIIEVKNAAQQ